MGKIILTGDRPTGRLHVGHYVGSLRNRVVLQNSGRFEKLFFMIADAQALTDNFDHPQKVRDNIMEVALDYLACGIDPAKSTIFVQSHVSELTEMTFYYMNLVTLARLERKLATAEGKVRAAGEALTAARKAAAGELEQRIQTELRELDMKKVRFAICFEPKEPAQDGCDAIRFLMSANAGEDLKPIAKIASGGELARIMLALKNVLSEQEDIGTLVFDEVDTGVSGRAAQKVAEKLAQVSRRKQVLCVTHLPQLAAMADVHFCVEKGEVKGRTFTQVRRLERAQRQAELARISGGAAVTEALLQSAGELLDAAAAYREGLA